MSQSIHPISTPTTPVAVALSTPVDADTPSTSPEELCSRTQIPVIDVVTSSEMINFEESLVRSENELGLSNEPLTDVTAGPGATIPYRTLTLSRKDVVDDVIGNAARVASTARVPETTATMTSSSRDAMGTTPLVSAPEFSTSIESKRYDPEDVTPLPLTLAPPPLVRKPSKSINDFQLLKVLGRGAYGKVFLAKHLGSGDILAMKVMHKRELVKRNVVTNIKAERLVLESITHPFIVKLRYAFQTEQKLYLLMNFVPGGELFTKLDRDRDMPESQVRFFAAEVALALDYLHSQHIIYRDLKPENVLFTADGHVCLTDFGFARAHVVSNQDSDSFCGTVQYMAPEVVARSGHGKPADWWAFGCLIFEMLTTRTPFQNENRKQLQELILNANPVYPKWLSPAVRHLLKSLLTKDPEQRLTFAGIKTHPFFEGIDWDKLIRKEIKSPFRPKLKNDLDTSNFDPRFTVEPVVDTPPSSPATRARLRAERKERKEKREQELAAAAAAIAEGVDAASPNGPNGPNGKKAQKNKGKKGKAAQAPVEPVEESSDDETVGPLDPDAFDGFSFAGFSPYVPPIESHEDMPALSISDSAFLGDHPASRSAAALGLSPRLGASGLPIRGPLANTLGVPFAPPHLHGTPHIRPHCPPGRKKSEQVADDAHHHMANYNLRDGLFRLPSPPALGTHSPIHQETSPQAAQAAQLDTPRSAMRLHVISRVPLMNLDSASPPATSPGVLVDSNMGGAHEASQTGKDKSSQSDMTPLTASSLSPPAGISTVMTNSSRKTNVAQPSSTQSKPKTDGITQSSQPNKQQVHKQTSQLQTVATSQIEGQQGAGAKSQSQSSVRPTKQQLQRQQQRAELAARQCEEKSDASSKVQPALIVNASTTPTAPATTPAPTLPTPMPQPAPNTWAGRAAAAANKTAAYNPFNPSQQAPTNLPWNRADVTASASRTATSTSAPSLPVAPQVTVSSSSSLSGIPSLSTPRVSNPSSTTATPDAASTTTTTATAFRPRPGTYAAKLNVNAPSFVPSGGR